VLHYHDRDFVLVLLGFCAGLLLGASRIYPFPKYFCVTLLVWAFHSFVAHSHTWPSLARDAAYVLCLSAAVFGSREVIVRSGSENSLMKRSLLRVGALLLGYLAAYTSLSLAWGVERLGVRIAEQGQMGLLLATGSVLGVEIAEGIVGRRRMGVA
jgi:hypothetical protein